MHSLYKQMWGRLNPDEELYRVEAARYFHLAMRRFELLPNHPKGLEQLNLFDLAALDDPYLRQNIYYQRGHISGADLVERCSMKERQLQARCAGLLKVSRREIAVERGYDVLFKNDTAFTKLAQFYYETPIVFIHRTAQEFLLASTDGREILSHFQSSAKDDLSVQIDLMLARLLLFGMRDVDPHFAHDLSEFIRRLSDMDASVNKTVEMTTMMAKFLQRLHAMKRLADSDWFEEGKTLDNLLCDSQHFLLDPWNFSFSNQARSKRAVGEGVFFHYHWGFHWADDASPWNTIGGVQIWWRPQDLLGIVAHVGITQFLQAYLKEVDNGRDLADSYKNYLLLCTTTALDSDGLARISKQVDWLLESGADPNSRHHFTDSDSQATPMSTTPFLEFLKSWGDRRRSNTDSQWLEMIRTFVSKAADLQQRILVRGYEESVNRKQTTYGLVLEVNIADLLRWMSKVPLFRGLHALSGIGLERCPSHRKILYVSETRNRPFPVETWWQPSAVDSRLLLLALSNRRAEIDELQKRTKKIGHTEMKENREEFWDETVGSQINGVISRSTKIGGLDEMTAIFRQNGWLASEGHVAEPSRHFG